MKLGYTLFAVIVLGGYTLSTWRGWDFGSPRRGLVPASVRQSPGGYRSYYYWTGGK
jgi:hypothetical protein